MSAILTILGRATRDPEMQQGKNSGTEYVSLDIAVSQRGQDGKEETIYYQCYFNKFLAERLAKAGVKKGTGLMIYGDLELHPFIYQKGKNAGQANAGPRINPARSAPTTCGICTRLVNSPSNFVDIRIIAKSSKYLYVSIFLSSFL